MSAAKQSSGSTAPKLVNNKEDYEKIMKETDTFLFDCDGVIWIGDKAIEGAVKVISQLKKLNKNVFFVSNNSTKTRDQYFDKFSKLGFSDIKISQVFGTAYTSALYLKKTLSPKGKVYLVGNEAMQKQLESFGITCFGVGPDSAVTSQSVPEILELPLDPDVEAVLVGMDGHISFTKLIKAASYLADPKCKFVATNEDNKMPFPGHKHVIIGTGVIVDSVISASGRQPDVWCGKPHSFMIDCVKSEVEVNCARTVMVGDRMNTDILFGTKNGMKTLLVMSGVEDEASLSKVCENPSKQDQVPCYKLDSLNDWAGF